MCVLCCVVLWCVMVCCGVLCVCVDETLVCPPRHFMSTLIACILHVLHRLHAYYALLCFLRFPVFVGPSNANMWEHLCGKHVYAWRSHYIFWTRRALHVDAHMEASELPLPAHASKISNGS